LSHYVIFVFIVCGKYVGGGGGQAIVRMTSLVRTLCRLHS